MMWGKNEKQKIRFDDYKRYSMPYPVSDDIEVT